MKYEIHAANEGGHFLQQQALLHNIYICFVAFLVFCVRFVTLKRFFVTSQHQFTLTEIGRHFKQK